MSTWVVCRGEDRCSGLAVTLQMAKVCRGEDRCSGLAVTLQMAKGVRGE